MFCKWCFVGKTPGVRRAHWFAHSRCERRGAAQPPGGARRMNSTAGIPVQPNEVTLRRPSPESSVLVDTRERSQPGPQFLEIPSLPLVIRQRLLERRELGTPRCHGAVPRKPATARAPDARDHPTQEPRRTTTSGAGCSGATSPGRTLAASRPRRTSSPATAARAPQARDTYEKPMTILMRNPSKGCSSATSSGLGSNRESSRCTHHGCPNAASSGPATPRT